uniref:Uncharacterized protein n=1 Tax=Cacopsylla melanoneura TaxID=428564 RepID=A0A8D9ARF7_9HEMI
MLPLSFVFFLSLLFFFLSCFTSCFVLPSLYLFLVLDSFHQVSFLIFSILFTFAYLNEICFLLAKTISSYFLFVLQIPFSSLFILIKNILWRFIPFPIPISLFLSPPTLSHTLSSPLTL